MRRCPFCAGVIQHEAVACKHCGRELLRPSRQKRDDVQDWSGLRNVLAGIGLVVSLGLVVALWTGSDRSTLADNLLPPVEYSLPTAAVEIRPGSYRSWSWEADERRPACRVHAQVIGITGGNKDFEAFLVDQDGMTNWENGTHPTVHYQSGRVSAATIDDVVRGAGPRYYLILSNMFSAITTKSVQLSNARIVCTAA